MTVDNMTVARKIDSRNAVVPDCFDRDQVGDNSSSDEDVVEYLFHESFQETSSMNYHNDQESDDDLVETPVGISSASSDTSREANSDVVHAFLDELPEIIWCSNTDDLLSDRVVIFAMLLLAGYPHILGQLRENVFRELERKAKVRDLKTEEIVCLLKSGYPLTPIDEISNTNPADLVGRFFLVSQRSAFANQLERRVGGKGPKETRVDLVVNSRPVVVGRYWHIQDTKVDERSYQLMAPFDVAPLVYLLYYRRADPTCQRQSKKRKAVTVVGSQGKCDGEGVSPFQDSSSSPTSPNGQDMGNPTSPFVRPMTDYHLEGTFICQLFQENRLRNLPVEPEELAEETEPNSPNDENVILKSEDELEVAFSNRLHVSSSCDLSEMPQNMSPQLKDNRKSWTEADLLVFIEGLNPELPEVQWARCSACEFIEAMLQLLDSGDRKKKTSRIILGWLRLRIHPEWADMLFKQSVAVSLSLLMARCVEYFTNLVNELVRWSCRLRNDYERLNGIVVNGRFVDDDPLIVHTGFIKRFFEYSSLYVDQYGEHFSSFEIIARSLQKEEELQQILVPKDLKELCAKLNEIAYERIIALSFSNLSASDGDRKSFSRCIEVSTSIVMNAAFVDTIDQDFRKSSVHKHLEKEIDKIIKTIETFLVERAIPSDLDVHAPQLHQRLFHREQFVEERIDLLIKLLKEVSPALQPSDHLDHDPRLALWEQVTATSDLLLRMKTASNQLASFSKSMNGLIDSLLSSYDNNHQYGRPFIEEIGCHIQESVRNGSVVAKMLFEEHEAFKVAKAYSMNEGLPRLNYRKIAQAFTRDEISSRNLCQRIQAESKINRTKRHSGTFNTNCGCMHYCHGTCGKWHWTCCRATFQRSDGCQDS